MAESSVEYSTLIELTVDLRLAVRPHLLSLSGALLASRLISPDSEVELRDTVHSETERAAKLVGLVQNKVKQNSRHYHTFIGILERDSDSYVYNDILQKLEQSYHSHRQEEGTQIVDTSVDVLSHMNNLERRFRLLHGRILAELEQNGTKVSDILQSVTLLPIAIRPEYKPAITEIFPDIRRETTISELFYHLNPLVDFLGYGLIKYIIDQFGSNTLKKMMNKYSEDVVQFMKKTTVKQLMDHWPGQQEIPPNFSKLQAKIDEDPTKYTLYDLDQKRRYFCGEVRLTEVVLVLIGLKMSNSFIVEWLVPSALVPKLIESARQLDFRFYLRERILKMVVEEKQIIPFIPNPKPKVPALQTTAAMVTDQTNMQDDKDDKDDIETDSAAKRHPLSTKQLSLSLSEQQEAQSIRDKLSDSSSYSGVGIGYNDLLSIRLRVERTLGELHFKYIDLDQHIHHQVDLNTCLSTIAQSKAYPKTPSAAGSQPFVITVFITGVRGQSPGSLYSQRGSMDIVDDIIKPFLPKSAPHLAHIPKLFFISSLFSHRNLDTQPPCFPDNDGINYCIAYHLAQWISDQRRWMLSMADGLRSGKTVQDVIEDSRSCLDKDSEQLYTFSCLN